MIPDTHDILAARRRLRGRVDTTPLRDSEWLTSIAGHRLALKLESVQRTGSFKIRGAFNALLLNLERGTAGADGTAHVVTASAGNHGRAIATAARALGMRATIFAPASAPRAKLTAIERSGAELRLERSYDEAEAAARAHAAHASLPFISAYNDPDVIAGAGTIALEVFEAMPSIAAIVVPVGGGGLISGIAIAAKSIAPSIRIVGVECEASHAMLTSLRAGRVTAIDPQPTLADGLAGNLDSETITFPIVQRYVDDIVTVTEKELANALRALLAEEHLVVEGAGAAAVAALMAGSVRIDGAAIAVVSGSNVDAERLMSVCSGAS